MTIPGVGGNPPMPPGYVPPGLPDVSAGSVNIFRGRLVIVFGPAGTVSGIFVYQQGTTPGPGNTPIVAITNSATDPFGNAVQGTIQVTGIGTLNVGSAPNPQVQLRTSGGVSGVIDFLLNSASFVDGLLVCGIIGGSFAALNLQGPGSTVVGHRDRIRIQLNTSDGVSSFANVQYVYTSDTGVDQIFMFEDAGGIGINVCANLTAADPSVAATATAPAISETWHDLRPLTNLFIGTTAGIAPPQYRKCADGDVEIYGRVKTPPAAGNYNGVVWGNLLPAYRPNKSVQCLVSAVADGAATPVMSINPNGDLLFNFLPAALAQTVIGIGCRFPLDSTGIIQV